jgi:hypothetical protein
MSVLIMIYMLCMYVAAEEILYEVDMYDRLYNVCYECCLFGDLSNCVSITYPTPNFHSNLPHNPNVI